jgi:hypothetical protein
MTESDEARGIAKRDGEESTDGGDREGGWKKVEPAKEAGVDGVDGTSEGSTDKRGELDGSVGADRRSGE